ncbi:FGGY-family carbohydrate kinase [Mucilaginibacter myungsuensis]|uniref:Carbohydrate kinase n=1 Tax=Mucilaginibacter myungsuensis TaxID=649104 RepID=A0A929L1G7_9SPHI|nr:FGGY family carbohydrate kinase [Mucilaginibacter myungsuensis]MBE9661516.1 carbohydrate kinase [Mucilaginibacter myungsuensis]MDN3597659.1 FGGY family carbohydrate kinase [Mucilaginibacter myungsuensis]
MAPIPVIAVFDVGKTNKKLFLFDESYHIVFERSARFNETVDEDGFACENLEALRLSVYDSLAEVGRLKEFDIKAVNFSAYGASFVYLDENGKAIAPLYNYLKPYPEDIKKQFYDTYGDEAQVAFETASPALESLNSGLQLYRIKHQKPELFKKIKHALHLPQYLSYLVSGEEVSDMTSIGCHTALWDFEKNDYHDWVKKEGIADIFAPVVPADHVSSPVISNKHYKVGIGLHDSSAALIPYLASFNEPFILLSTGTWSISLNPFDQSPLTAEELAADCLNYIQYKGKPVKASRLFSGHEYDQGIKQIAEKYGQNTIKYRNLAYDDNPQEDDVKAYYDLVKNLIAKQKISTGYVLKNAPVKRIFVDGGFGKNSVFMHLLAAAFPDIEVYAASMAQATAMGTALAIHHKWNSRPIPNDLISLKYYSAAGQKV